MPLIFAVLFATTVWSMRMSLQLPVDHYDLRDRQL